MWFGRVPDINVFFYLEGVRTIFKVLRSFRGVQIRNKIRKITHFDKFSKTVSSF